MMVTHGDLWRSIDLLVENNRLSVSGLARVLGLDRSAFAKNKRRQGDRSRWPPTESLSRILNATNSNMSRFTALLPSCDGQPVSLEIPVIEFAQASRSGYFDDSGYPVASGWDTLDFPNLGDVNAYSFSDHR